jgi:GT2 family glycosyltransferase
MNSPQNRLDQLLERSNYYSSSTINLSFCGLTPVVPLSSKKGTYREIETMIPLLSGKSLQWFLDWPSDSETISSVFLKIGTGDRMNHCRLELSLWQEQLNHYTRVASASIDGTTVQDNQWTQFDFKEPIKPGQYLCQLESPDADNYLNTLFVWLTVIKDEILEQDNLFESYYYGLVPIISLFEKSDNTSVKELGKNPSSLIAPPKSAAPILSPSKKELPPFGKGDDFSFPFLLKGKLQWPLALRGNEAISAIFMGINLPKGGHTLQWPLAWDGSEAISTIFVKFDSSSQKNDAQLVLSILPDQYSQNTEVRHINDVSQKESKWAQFLVEPPLSAGKYRCQLQLPDTNHSVHQLFLWLLVKTPEDFCPSSQNLLGSLFESGNYQPTSIVNLSDCGLMPVVTLSPIEDTYTGKDTLFPVLQGKSVQWLVDFQSSSDSISSVFIKLGTGGRINHCRLELSLFQAYLNLQTKVASASVDGITVQDNQWTQFDFKSPIKSGKYLCQLRSPDTDNVENTLFVWVTTAKPQVLVVDNVFDSYYYGLVPIQSLSAKPANTRKIETIYPLLRRQKTLQWPIEWEGKEEISTLFLRLGTGSRINRCQLVLSILQEQQNSEMTLVAKAYVEGASVEDSLWTPFIFETPIKAGKYVCQLESPDTEVTNALFIWLTTAKPELARLKKYFPTIIDLYYSGLTPIAKYFPKQKYYQPLKSSMPLLRGRILQWPLYFEIEKSSKFPVSTSSTTDFQREEISSSVKKKRKEELSQISTIYLKLGTGGRKNQCQLVLSVFQEQSNHQKKLVATAYQKGALIRDNQWTKFVLDHPLDFGHYICQLESPDTDDTDNVLFIGLTTVKSGLANYCYRSSNQLFSLFSRSSLSNKMRDSLRKRVRERAPYNPLISIIVPIFATDDKPAHLRDCLNSVLKQTYPHWELCIASQVSNLRDSELDKFQPRFSRQIKIAYGELNQTVAALYNQALELVTGKLTILLYPDDLLTQDALSEIVKSLEQSVETVDMLYSDEDKVNERGFFDEPYFKPDWSPNLLYGHLYTGQLSVYRTQLLKDIGGFREELSDQAVWDMVFRLTEKSRHILHVPKILYHRRKQLPEPVNKNVSLKVVQEALNREGQGGYVTVNSKSPQSLKMDRIDRGATENFQVHYPVKGQPLVSIIIPTKDMAPTLTSCIESLSQITTYLDWEIIVVDNGSTEADTFALFEKYQAKLGEAFKIVRQDKPFNFSQLVNEGVKIAQGEILLLLNNDTEIVGPSDWLQTMIGFAQHSKIGAVGCKLLYPQDNTIQHAGLICGIGGVANPGHKYFPANSPGYFNRLAVVANYSAITGACLMVERRLWEQVNGFDENLAIAFNDVDFCLKLLNQGFYHVVLPYMIFYHYESKSRGFENTEAKKKRLQTEAAYMRQRWGALLQNDPFYNPHLTQKVEDFRLASESIYYSVETRKWWQRWL